MESVIILAPMLFAALVFANRAGHVARQRNRPYGEGFVLGLILGPFGPQIASKLPRQNRGLLSQADRDCYLMIAGFVGSTRRFAR